MTRQNKLIFKTIDIKSAGTISESVKPYECPEISDSVARQELDIYFTLQAVDENVLLNGKIQGILTLACCRCLESFALPIDIKLAQAYPVTLEEINIEDEIRQQMILNTPQKPLCAPDCSGLCPQCGRNLNTGKCGCSAERVDPRWDSLKKLIK